MGEEDRREVSLEVAMSTSHSAMTRWMKRTHRRLPSLILRNRPCTTRMRAGGVQEQVSKRTENLPRHSFASTSLSSQVSPVCLEFAPLRQRGCARIVCQRGVDVRGFTLSRSPSPFQAAIQPCSALPRSQRRRASDSTLQVPKQCCSRKLGDGRGQLVPS